MTRPNSSASNYSNASSKASMEAKRNAKRRQMEALFEQQQAIQKHMQALQEELQALDDEIDALAEEEESTVREISFEEQDGEPAELQMPLTMLHPDEILTEPMTQYPRDGRDPDRSSIGNYLHIHKDTARSGQTHNTVVQYAALPEGLRPTSRTPDRILPAHQSSDTINQDVPSAETSESETNSMRRPNLVSLQSTPKIPQTTSDGQSFPWSSQVDHLLRHTFRIVSFRGHQKEIIDSTLRGRDVFVIMRTGGGKSLTYQLPALLEGRGPSRKITLVISPLLSLIRDQEDQMNDFCANSAISFTSSLGNAEQNRRWGLVRDPDAGICLILVTPEKVHKSGKLRGELQKLHQQHRLGRFVIDECHCACQWGHDFRPDYTKLGLLKTQFPHVPLMAVTATASDRVRKDCSEILRIGTNYQFFRSTSNRPNLTYSVRPKIDGKDKVIEEMAHFIHEKHTNNAGIIYTFSRKEADDVADKLCERGIVARSYHSSVSDAAKDHIHRSWMRNETQVVVATIAFGLGINKPDVKFVLHHTVSKSLEAYYQESGRAGRDGNPADCVLFYSPKDVARMICLIHGEAGEATFWPMVQYAQAAGNDAVCKGIILTSLGEPGCPNMDTILAQNDGITTEQIDVGKHAKTVTELLKIKANRGEDLTIPMLVKEWRAKASNIECVKKNPPGKDFTGDECERIIVCLLIEHVISPNIVWNAYCSTMYLKLGPNASRLLASPDPKVFIRLPKRLTKAPKRTPAKSDSTNTAASIPIISEVEWIDSTKKTKRKSVASKNDKKPRKKAATASKSRGKKAPIGKLKSLEQHEAEIIELDSSSDEHADSKLAAKKSRSHDDLWDDPASSDGEFEFS